MAIKKVRMKPPGYTDIVHPETSADVVIEDASHRFVTDSEKGIWNAKQPTITGGATTITSSNLTTNRALVSDASGKVAVSAVTSTQLGYLSGATGNIQTQMNLKLERNNDVGSGVGVGTLTIADANLLQGFPASTFARQSDLASANTKIGLGGIVESGSNTNGRYIKYNDGVAICTKRIEVNVSVTTAWGSLYLSGDVNLGNFAIAFTEIPRVSTSLVRSAAGFIEGLRSTTGSFIGNVGVARANSTTQPYAFEVIAVGMWK